MSVTPGIDNGTALTLLKKHPDVAALEGPGRRTNGLAVDYNWLDDPDIEPGRQGRPGAGGSYDKGIDLYTGGRAELRGAHRGRGEDVPKEYPSNRIRLKAHQRRWRQGPAHPRRRTAYRGS